MSVHNEEIMDLTVREALAQGYHLVKTSKLDEDKVRQIRVMLQDGFSQKAVASKFDITVGTVSHIATGRRWAHVK